MFMFIQYYAVISLRYVSGDHFDFAVTFGPFARLSLEHCGCISWVILNRTDKDTVHSALLGDATLLTERSGFVIKGLLDF